MTATIPLGSQCSVCGRRLTVAVTEGLCPACLARELFAVEDGPKPGEEPPAEQLPRIGDYELVERIARGGMGIVYRARQVSLDRVVAVKVLLDSVFASTDELARFRAEAAAAAALQHPNIVAIHEVGEDQGSRFFSMDFIAGQDLAALTHTGPLPAREAAQLLVKIADAIEHVHQRGILHRDLKPSNVLVDGLGEPHVTDFGLAKRFERDFEDVNRKAAEPGRPLTMTGQVVGTPGYMSPEQASAKRDIEPSTDIYSLGALLYHLLTGRAPFVAETPTAVLRQVEDAEPVLLTLLNPSVPRDLETICLRCLNKEPARRYNSAAELGADLGRFLRDEPILARPITAAERGGRWCRRNPIVASLMFTVGLLLIMVAVVSSLSARRLSRERHAEAVLRGEAEARLRQGERLINFMLGDLADRLEPVGRLDVLESTISQVDQYYSDIQPERLTPESQRHRANALFQFAGIRASQGHLPEAVTNYLKAIQAYDRLTTASPTNLQWQFELTRAWNDLGIAFARQGEFTNAADTLSHSLKARDRLIELQPTNVFWIASYGATAQNLGQVTRHLGRLDQAAQFLAKAESALRTWVRVEPNSLTPKERLATVRGSTGQLLEALGKFDEAVNAYGDKVEILRNLLILEPNNTHLQADLANGLGTAAALEGGQSNFVAATAFFSEGIKVDEALVARDPANREWQLDLVCQLAGLGDVFRQTGRFPEAIDNYRRVWQLSEAQADGARQFQQWINNWRQSLEAGEQLERQQADLAAARGDEKAAAECRKLAEELKLKRLGLPP